MTTYSIKLFENPGSKEKTNGMTYHTMSKAAAIADRLFNTGLYYEVQVINNDNGQAWYTQKNQRPETKETQTMTLERLNQMIDEAITAAEIRPQAMKQTNILNAEYATGKVFAILDIIHELYGIDALIAARERTQAATDALTLRTQELY